MFYKVESIEEIISLLVMNPTLAKKFKQNPKQVSELFGIQLTDEDAKVVSQKLDLKSLAEKVKDLDSFAVKVNQGISLKKK